MVGAVFLDRDGVINELVWHDGEWGAPRHIDEIKLVDGINTLISALNKHYLLFVVSNQPDAAKGYTPYENHMKVLKWFENVYRHDIIAFYWCLHHPLKCQCLCRKPGTWSVEQAITKYDIDRSKSYFIGDRDTDIECGVAAGLNTIKVIDYNLEEIYRKLL